jgi:hypothetical protein
MHKGYALPICHCSLKMPTKAQGFLLDTQKSPGQNLEGHSN